MDGGGLHGEAGRMDLNDIGDRAAAPQFYAPGSRPGASPVYHSRAQLPFSLVLRVGLNATALALPRTGIGNYIVHLAAALGARSDVELHAFEGAGWRVSAQPPPDAPAAGTSAKIRAVLKPLDPFKRRLRRVIQQHRFARGARTLSLDLYHEPNYVPIESDLPLVTTIHDLSWIRYPGMHPADRVRWLEHSMPRAVDRAAAILVDSDFTRSEVIAQFRCPAERVHTAHLGVAGEFHPRTSEQTCDALAPFGLTHGGYVLNVGTIEPRKNLGHVLDAYLGLPAGLRKRYPLVVAGARGWRAAAIEKRLHTLDASSELRFLGRVDHDALAPLYAGAAAFVFPSLYEGFGLPPLEAMASGVPVLASNRASIPEVVGDGAVLVDPDSPEETSKRLQALLEDAAMRADLGRRGVERARAFTWDACAARTLVAYRAALQAAGR
jgi:O-antigen biosynthesis alpha-1,3-rhamnosyltransferase